MLFSLTVLSDSGKASDPEISPLISARCAGDTAVRLMAHLRLEPGLPLNTKDFRFLWRSEVLLASGSVCALESVFMMAVLGWGHAICPRVAAGLACGSTVRGPAGRFLLPGGFGFPAAARGSR